MKYEMMLLLDPKQTEKELEKILKEIKSSLGENGFEVTDEDVWGFRDLAYKIKGNTAAYYVVLLFEGDSAGAQPLVKDLRIQPGLIRYMIMKVDDDYNIIRYDQNINPGDAKPKLSKHAEELAKKVSKKRKDVKEEKKKVEEGTVEEQTKEEGTKEEDSQNEDLDEKLKAIIDDTDIDL